MQLKTNTIFGKKVGTGRLTLLSARSLGQDLSAIHWEGHQAADVRSCLAAPGPHHSTHLRRGACPHSPGCRWGRSQGPLSWAGARPHPSQPTEVQHFDQTAGMRLLLHALRAQLLGVPRGGRSEACSVPREIRPQRHFRSDAPQKATRWYVDREACFLPFKYSQLSFKL